MSPARAVGLWQLMASTAGELGLEVTSVVDERRHVHRSTGAALDFVGHMHAKFLFDRRLRAIPGGTRKQILREGEPGSEMFFIEAGRVRVDRASGAKAVVIAELAAGDLFGEMSLLTSNPRSATVTARARWVCGRITTNSSPP
mgnify:CR=1 FL=1